MALRYRQLEAPALLDASHLETGDSEAAASLSRAFKTFEGIAEEPAANLRANLGQQQGAQAGASGSPEFRAGLRATTAYGQAYNNSALRSYAIKAEGDAEDTAARLEMAANNDPDKFAATFGAVRDETLKNAPAEARGTLATIYASRAGQGVARIRQARTAEILKQSQADTSEGVSRGVDRIAALRASDDPAKQLEAEEEEVKLQLLIDGATNDGTITPTESGALRRQAHQAITAQTISKRFQAELDNPYGNPVQFIERLKKANKDSDALAPAEEDKLVAGLLADLREKNSLEAAGNSLMNSEAKARYDAGDREATSALFSGTLTTRKLNEMVEQQRLDPAVARTLMNELQTGDTTGDDPHVAFNVKTDLLNYSEDDIKTMQGLSWKTRAELIEKRRTESEGWKGTQAAREAQDRIDGSLGIVPGTMMQGLTDDEKRQRSAARIEFYNTIDALPPAERQAAVLPTADAVIKKFIRTNKVNEAQSIRAAKQSFVTRAGAPDKMSPTQLKTYNEKLMRYDAAAAAAEAEAARQ